MNLSDDTSRDSIYCPVSKHRHVRAPVRNTDHCIQRSQRHPASVVAKTLDQHESGSLTASTSERARRPNLAYPPLQFQLEYICTCVCVCATALPCETSFPKLHARSYHPFAYTPFSHLPLDRQSLLLPTHYRPYISRYIIHNRLHLPRADIASNTTPQWPTPATHQACLNP